MNVCVYVCMYVYDITRNVTSEGNLAQSENYLILIGVIGG